MARTIRLNFKGAPPSAGDRSDVIPPGDYRLEVAKMAETKSKSSGKPMIVANFKVSVGEQKGKRLRENFMLPQSKDDSLVGLQRLHACLLSLGVKVPADREFRLDFDSITARKCEAVVVNGQLPANGDYPARTISEITEYKIPTAASAKRRAEPEDDDDEDEDDEDEDEDSDDDDDEEDDDEDDDEDEEDEEDDDAEPVAVAPRRARAAAPAASNGKTATKTKKKAAASAAPRKRRAAAVKDDDEDEGGEFPF